MLRQLFNRLRKRQSGHESKDAQTHEKKTLVVKKYSAKDCRIDAKDISPLALRVIQQLQQSNYQAYIVGGALRDLLLGGQPKDYDVATNATPEQIKQAIRNSRIIGRRFRLVHVFQGRDMVEVATFRGQENPDVRVPAERLEHESGRILRDNVFGTLDQDALRRDFTINALYYDPIKGEIIDFVDGKDDIEQRHIRLIGEPERRYREDPVRLLRALRFAAKLDFTLDPACEVLIRGMAPLLHDIPAPRRFDELLKLLLGGQALKTMHLLEEYEVLPTLIPTSLAWMQQQPQARQLVEQALINTDERIRIGKSINPAFMLSVLLWHPFQALFEQLLQQGQDKQSAFFKACDQVIAEQSLHTSISKRFSMMIRDIWGMQPKLIKRDPRHIETLIQHLKFRAGYDFLLLRESVGDVQGHAGSWWTDYQEANLSDRENMVAKLQTTPAQKKRRRPSSKKKKAGIDSKA